MSDTLMICMKCRAARKARGITLAQLSDMCGLSVMALSKFENGKYDAWMLQAYKNYVLVETELHAINDLI